MNRRGWTRIAAAGFVLVGCLPVALAAEGVNASRYILHRTGTSMTGVSVVDSGVLDEFCRDDDGCLATLRVDGNGFMAVASDRVFLQGGSLVWATQSLGAQVDGDNLVDVAVTVGFGPNACTFGDGQSAPDGDDTVGFGLSAFSNAGAICTLVLVD